MENIGENSQKERIPTKLPKIIYGESLLSPMCPYEVAIDVQGCSELLELAGVNQDSMNDVTIALVRSSGIPLGPLANYDFVDKRIEIFTDRLWKKQEKIIKKADKILKKTEGKNTYVKNDNSFPELASGRKLSWYLNVAPRERVRKVVEKMAEIAIGKKSDAMLYHEAKHAGDHDRKGMRFPIESITAKLVPMFAGMAGVTALMQHYDPNLVINLGYGFLAGLNAVSLFYTLQPIERRARKFSRELENSSKFKLITLTPRHKAKI